METPSRRVFDRSQNEDAIRLLAGCSPVARSWASCLIAVLRLASLQLPPRIDLRNLARVENAFRKFLEEEDTYLTFRQRSGLDTNPVDSIFGLNEFERLAIWIYASSSTWHAKINDALWLLNRSRIGVGAEVSIVAVVLARALRKLPRHRGFVYRGYYTPYLDRFLRGSGFKIGDVYEWPTFLSTSKRPEKAYSGNVLFTILSRNGRVLGYYAPEPEEEEVLFTSLSRFRVRAIERRPHKAFIEMVEAHGSSKR
jgi:NAD:arginine ADP-ribosyltransferase